MSIRTFWIIFLKIVGLWFAVQAIVQITSTFSFMLHTGQNTLELVIILLVAILLTGLFLCLFLFKPDWFVDKLKLDRGFDTDKLDLSISYSTILSIATIVIGGVLLIDSLPRLLMEVVAFLQQKKMAFGENPSSKMVILQLAKTIIGYLLMTNSRAVVKFIEKHSSKSPS